MRFEPIRKPDARDADEFSRRARRSGPDSGIEDLLLRVARAAGGETAGASGEAIDAAEAAFGVPFPEAYRRFLEVAGAPSKSAPWRGLWRVDELVSLNRSLPVFRWFGGLVGIGNEGFIVTALDYRGGGDPPIVSVGLSSSDPADVTLLAETFEEWLALGLPRA
jgi:hypothetical protein